MAEAVGDDGYGSGSVVEGFLNLFAWVLRAWLQAVHQARNMFVGSLTAVIELDLVMRFRTLVFAGFVLSYFEEATFPLVWVGVCVGGLAWLHDVCDAAVAPGAPSAIGAAW